MARETQDYMHYSTELHVHCTSAKQTLKLLNTQLNLLIVTCTSLANDLKVNRENLVFISHQWKCKKGK